MTHEITQHSEALSYLLQSYTGLICMRDINEKSRERYMYDAEDFISFVTDNGFDETTLLKFKTYLDSRADLGSSTKRGKLRMAIFLCQRLFDRGMTKMNYAKEVSNFKISTGHKKEGLNQQEVNLIFNYFETLPYQENISYKLGETEVKKTISTFKRRNILIASLLSFQGLRQFELCNLLIEDISLNNKTALIKGKHRDDKELIHLHPKTINSIKEYLTITGDKTGYLIKSRRGIQLTQSAIRHIFTNKDNGIFKLCEIENKSVHGFRHYFITTLLEKFGDPSTVMKFARLKTLQTVMVYDDRLSLERHLETFRDLF